VVVVRTAICLQTDDGGRISDLKMAALRRPSDTPRRTSCCKWFPEVDVRSPFKEYGAVPFTNLGTLCAGISVQSRRARIAFFIGYARYYCNTTAYEVACVYDPGSVTPF
jgi:hypothetical protein